jgi:hypothetical protein
MNGDILMSRVLFTAILVDLLDDMIRQGDHPIVDYVKRSEEEQKRLFDAGLSKCDGVTNISKHQVGRAVDIYLIKDGAMLDWAIVPEKAKWYHDLWESLGGKPSISWDEGHFEL